MSGKWYAHAFRGVTLAVAVWFAPRAAQSQVDFVLTVGDSMTEEYAFEVPFSAPDADPDNANVRNWVEILRIWRGADFWFGGYEQTAFFYGDWRNAGHELNFGVPGFTVATDWWRVLNADSLPAFPPPTITEIADYNTRNALIAKIPQATVAVILIGANDLKNDYNDIFNGTEPSNFYSRIVNRTRAIRDFIRSRHPTLPIVICTVPDVGVTPDTRATYDPVAYPEKRASARAKVLALANDIRTMAAANGATVADVHALTLAYEDANPFRINGTTFHKDGHPQNPPLYLFCKDGFHAATALHALIANLIIDAINRATGRNHPLLTHREILQQILGLNPDQPYLDWITPFAPAQTGPTDDPDADGWDNLAEYALGGNPARGDGSLLLRSVENGRLGIDYPLTPVSAADGYLSITPEWSGDLTEWWNSGITVQGLQNGSLRASIPITGPQGFLRLAIRPRP